MLLQRNHARNTAHVQNRAIALTQLLFHTLSITVNNEYWHLALECLISKPIYVLCSNT